MSTSRYASQRQHEDDWGKRWVAALGRHMKISRVRRSRPKSDPPDVVFHVSREDGTETKTWGEITDVYYDNREAQALWRREPSSRPFPGYVGPDETIAARAEKETEKKLGKYATLVEQHGRGHLLIVLVSPFTTRGTRVEAEERILEQLYRQDRAGSRPFETVWLGYQLPWTSPAEREDPKYAFRDPTADGRFNFFKCIWEAPIP